MRGWMMRKDFSRVSSFRSASVAGSAIVVPTMAFAQDAAPAEAAAQADAADGNPDVAASEIIVTGFRKSSEAASN
ncbi:hypothetical protein OY671_012720, partial [Metschnikowia pulcherrima]